MAFTQKALGKAAGLACGGFSTVSPQDCHCLLPYWGWFRVPSEPCGCNPHGFIFLNYTHPHAAAQIALPWFRILSSLVVSAWKGWCLISAKKKKGGASGSLIAFSQLCKRKLFRSLPWTSFRTGNSCRRVWKSISVRLDWMYVIWGFAVARREGAVALPRAAPLYRHISGLPVTSLQRKVMKRNDCEKRNENIVLVPWLRSAVLGVSEDPSLWTLALKNN